MPATSPKKRRRDSIACFGSQSKIVDHCCVNIRSGGERAVVTGDLFHHALQCREPQWSTIFDWDPQAAIASRRKFFGEVAGTGIVTLPIHFPHPTAGRIESDGERFRYDFLR